MSDSEKKSTSNSDLPKKDIPSEVTPAGDESIEAPKAPEPKSKPASATQEETPDASDTAKKEGPTDELKVSDKPDTDKAAENPDDKKDRTTETGEKKENDKSKRPKTTSAKRKATGRGGGPGGNKVDSLVKKKQKEEENLTGKLLILDKMEGLAESIGESTGSWADVDKEFNGLDKQWSKIGRIPPERNQELWHRYHGVQEKFHEKRFANDDKYRQRIENFLTKKKTLIREAEALLDYKDLAEASRDVNKLHRKWKKIGNLPRKDENELWNEFKAATDAFHDKKEENIDVVREQEEKHLTDKKNLVEQAEKLKDSDDWDEAHETYQKLMEEWKKTGPVPRRQSGKVWKQFKRAMDHFYNRRREHYKEIKKKRKSNLDEKKEVLSQLKALETHEDPLQAVEEAKPLQEAFKSAGYVPIKHKNKLWKEYREACDVIYDRYRAASSAAEVVGRENVSDFSTDDLVHIKNKQNEADKLRGDIHRMQNDLLQMEESLSYFKPSGTGSSVLDQAKEKISAVRKKIESGESRLKALDKELDKLTSES